MHLAVLDTNMIVSASISTVGPPAKIIANWVLAGNVNLVTSPRVVTEYREVVRRAKFHRYKFPPLWLEHLIEGSMQLPDSNFGLMLAPTRKTLRFWLLRTPPEPGL